MGGILAAWIAFAFLLIAAPIAGSALGVEIGGLAAAIMIVTGIGLLLVAGILLVITKLYVKTRADEAFVRTGMGGMRIIKDGGAVVVPVVHQVVLVPLRTFRLEVSRRGADALLTADKLRADIKAEFFIRIQPNDEDITNAARSLGDRTEHEGTIRQLIEDKLVSALRTIAATKTLEELNSKRDEFVRAVMDSVSADLKHNGFTLETATISQLDQADAAALRQDNVFDAEGLLTIARVTQAKLTERNGIQRTRERERLAQDVEARQQMLELERNRAEAEAKQAAEIATARADQERAAREAQIKAEQAVAAADLEKTKALETQKATTEQAVAVAQQARAQAEEVAQRSREIAVAEKETERADAVAKLIAAEKVREIEAQAVETVKVEAAANRAKQQQVIGAQAQAETAYVAAEKAADAKAYAVTKDAEARKEAASADAEAITRKAEAEAQAAKKRAEGAEAEALVPVRVQQETVEVERRRVEVLTSELTAREAHGRVAQDFELARIRIEKEAEVRIEGAKAVAHMAAKVQATVFGTPEDAARMTTAYMRGMGLANTANGFFEAASAETNGAVHATGETIAKIFAAVAHHLGVKPEDVAKFLPPPADTGAPAPAAPKPPARA